MARLKFKISFAILIAQFFSVALLAQTSTPQKIQSDSRNISQKSAAPAQSKTASEAAEPDHSPDYSNEPFIIQEYSTVVHFENDGTGERTLDVRALVQNDTGVKRLSELVFGYDAANEKAGVRYLRVKHRDGSTVAADADAVTDSTPEILRDAPSYSNFKEEHVKVPPLKIGDFLEYGIFTKIVTPFAKGQFWYDHNFIDAAVVLDERLEINLPAGRKVILRSADPHFTQHESGGRKIYEWKRANVSVQSGGDSNDGSANPPPAKPGAGGPDTPAIELTSFATWEEVGKWYASLQHDRSAAAAEVRPQALALTSAHEKQTEKIQALYDFVSQKIKYVNLPLGVDGYQPHTPAEVLTNQYGDSKDKYVLLAAMLEAIGVHADAALMPLARKVDPLAPSPSQFDHVIANIPPSAAAAGSIWLDAGSGVAPFRYLVPNLRGKKALVISASGNASLAQTPKSPPFLSTQEVTVEGRSSDLGKLTAKIHYRLRGDNEFAFRSALRRAPESQWKQIGQTVAVLDGFHGEVSKIEAKDVSSTEKPLELTLDYTQKAFLDWTAPSSKIPIPLPALGMPDLPAEKNAPISLGSPLAVTLRLKLTLPPSDTIHAPTGIAVTRDYAEYHSIYAVAGDVITVERTMRFKMRELPASRADDYQAFTRAVLADGSQRVSIENPNASATKIPESATAAELVETGTAALDAGDARLALALLSRASELEPTRKDVWSGVGLAHLRLNEYDGAIAAFKKQIEINPKDETVYDFLGVTLVQQQKLDEAAVAFRKQIELKPLDKFAHASLGLLLVQQKKYAEAIPDLEKAAVLAPDNSQLQLTLADAYINAGRTKDAVAAFDKAAKISPTPEIWNNIAQLLAQKDLDLEKADQYAVSAVEAATASLKTADLDHLTGENLAQVQNLGAYWDTLGWIRVRSGDFDSAETYLRAAWKLTQNGGAGDHLAQLYEKRGQKVLAVQTYLLALSAPHSPKETQARLMALAGDGFATDERLKQARADLASERIYSVKNSGAEGVEADFWLLLVPSGGGAHAEATKFIHGSDSLRNVGDALRAVDFGAMFPSASPGKLVRRGTLACTMKAVDCTFILNRPEEVSSVE
jgi:tetratricopeptide (TPR) repeat protein